MILLAAAGTVAVMNLAPDNEGASPSPSARTATPSASKEPPPTPPPTTLAGAELPLRELAWWNVGYYAYGAFESPATPLPEDFKLLRIGTLDGLITAEMRINPRWSHSFVSGPVGTDVLIANDDGAQTSVFIVSAADGVRTDLFTTPDLIPAAILSGDGTAIYYVKADRASGVDAGLWSRRLGSGAEASRVAGPLGEPIGDALDDTTVWWLTLSPDQQTIVVQWCRGVECRTHLVKLPGGDRREASGAGWPIGVTDSLFVADGVPGSFDEIVAVDLLTAEVRTIVASRSPAQVIRLGNGWWLAFGRPVVLLDLLPGDGAIQPMPGDGRDRSGTSFDSLQEWFGVELPDGWILRWLEPSSIQPPEFTNGYQPGQLVNIATGERLDIGPFQPLSP